MHDAAVNVMSQENLYPVSVHSNPDTKKVADALPAAIADSARVMPVLGGGVKIYEGIIGRRLGTDEELSWGDRAWRIVDGGLEVLPVKKVVAAFGGLAVAGKGLLGKAAVSLPVLAMAAQQGDKLKVAANALKGKIGGLVQGAKTARSEQGS